MTMAAENDTSSPAEPAAVAEVTQVSSTPNAVGAFDSLKSALASKDSDTLTCTTIDTEEDLVDSTVTRGVEDEFLALGIDATAHHENPRLEGVSTTVFNDVNDEITEARDTVSVTGMEAAPLVVERDAAAPTNEGSGDMVNVTPAASTSDLQVEVPFEVPPTSNMSMPSAGTVDTQAPFEHMSVEVAESFAIPNAVDRGSRGSNVDQRFLR